MVLTPNFSGRNSRIGSKKKATMGGKDQHSHLDGELVNLGSLLVCGISSSSLRSELREHIPAGAWGRRGVEAVVGGS
ncbi:hypothetical protein NL676_003744 [Syzygium grande]|nr:hypothetical protein NL676_003744 [Syzygium grande]